MKRILTVLTMLTLSGCATIGRIIDALPEIPERPKPEQPANEFPDGTRWLHADVSGWPVTATLNASVDARTIHLRYDKANTWPVLRQRAQNGGPLVGNVWAVIQHDGQWYAVAWDWMRQGQQSKGRSSFRGSGGHMPGPLSNFTPRSGEVYYFFVSTAARGAERSSNERSNLSQVVWP